MDRLSSCPQTATDYWNLCQCQENGFHFQNFLQEAEYALKYLSIGKIHPVQAITSYKGSGGIDPLFFKSTIILVLWEYLVDYNSMKFETVQCMSLDYTDNVVQLFKSSELNKFHIKITFAVTNQ